MDLEEARRLLGLVDETLTIQELRAARNSALKAHHPDVARTDEAARRRATYWSSQINRAFEVLEANLGGPAPPATGERQRQSFSAAASRASQRASEAAEAEARREADRRAAEAKVAAEARAAAAQRAAEQQAKREAQARASEKAAAEAHAARQAAAARGPESREASDSFSMPRRRPQSGLLRLEERGRVALGVAIVVLLVPLFATVLARQPESATVAGSSLAGTAAEGPKITARATAAPTARMTPLPTQSPIKAAFDWWASAYQTSVSPCYSAGPCDLAFEVTYDDGTKATFAKEVERLAEPYRDNFALYFGPGYICADIRGSMFTLYAGMAAEVELVSSKKSSETPLPGWRPSQGASYAECGAAPGSAAERRAALLSTLGIAKSSLERANALYLAKDWAALQKSGLELAEIGTDLAQSTARDLTSNDPWQDARWIPFAALKVSGRLEIERLAAAPETGAALKDLITRVGALLDKMT